MFPSFPQKVPTHFPHNYIALSALLSNWDHNMKVWMSFLHTACKPFKYHSLERGLPTWLTGSKKTPAIQEMQEMWARSLGREDHQKEATGSNSLQYSCLENPMDREAWQAMAHQLPKSWTQLKRLSVHACTLERTLIFYLKLFSTDTKVFRIESTIKIFLFNFCSIEEIIWSGATIFPTKKKKKITWLSHSIL